jgi:tRNA pseudouridine38-40 synthase
MRYFIEISYKGTNLNGWQKQPNAPTVEEAIERAMSVVLKQAIEIVGSSRTDSGVHAEQQFAHFDTDMPVADIDRKIYAINCILPKDVAIKRIFEVADDFHARFAATHRCYEYRIALQKNPFLTHLAYIFTHPLDVNLMNQAASLLLNYTDFECFSKVNTDVKTFDCSIEYAYWEQQGQLLVFRIKANRFLRGMVRAIVGTLIEVGQQKRSIADFEAVIQSKNRKNAAAQAPAEGLFLTEVGY